MKVNITRVVPCTSHYLEITTVHYTRAKWNRKKSVVLSGVKKRGDKTWNVSKTYDIPSWWRHLSKEEILYKLFNF